MIARLAGGLFTLIGYASTATVLTLLIALGYLWQTDRLNDQKVFRMVALFHDVDLHQLAEAQKDAADEVPPEEVSLNEALRRQQVMDRHFEMKLLALRRGRQEYDHRLQMLRDLIDRYDRMAQDWQNRLKQQQELKSQEDLATIVSHFEMYDSPQAKNELMRWLEDGRMDDAILLMSKMSEKKLKKVLLEFRSPPEQAKLYEIHEKIFESSQQASQLNDALDELKTVGAQE
jgi:hypothetical protein